MKTEHYALSLLSLTVHEILDDRCTNSMDKILVLCNNTPIHYVYSAQDFFSIFKLFLVSSMTAAWCMHCTNIDNTMTNLTLE